MKKKMLLVILAATIFLVAGCQNSSKPNISALGYIEQLHKGLEQQELPVDDLAPSEVTEGHNSDLGDYTYTGYIVTNGVYASTYENPDQTELLQVRVTIDLALATRQNLSTGGFAIYNMISYFDQKNTDNIFDLLGANDIDTLGTSEADGENGHYKFSVNPGRNVMLVYTLNGTEDESK